MSSGIFRSKFAPVCTAVLAAAGGAHAWGPHRDITRAAFEALGEDDPLVRFLGDEVNSAAELSWLPDGQEGLVERKGEFFNANDYLLFSGTATHLPHGGKGAIEASGVFFRRALQAYRTETPMNTARWIGALVQFTEDSASPPHAHPTGGELHKKMEGWLDGNKIRIAGYRPKVLGDDEASAVAGIERRVTELGAFSRPRGQRLKPLAEKDRRAEMEPIELECAEECARAVADVLRTLGELGAPPVRGGVAVEGRITSAAVPGLAKVPAKVVLLKTAYSTLADEEGRYAFRNLPPGTYTAAVLRAGSGLVRAEVLLSAGTPAVKDFAPAPSDPPGNLLRNPDFQLRWLRRDAPDGWRLDEGSWVSEAVPVTGGLRYRLDVDWIAGGPGDVLLRWQDIVRRSGVKYKSEPPLGRGKPGQVFTAPAGFGFARIILRTKENPEKSFRRIALTAEP